MIPYRTFRNTVECRALLSLYSYEGESSSLLPTSRVCPCYKVHRHRCHPVYTEKMIPERYRPQ